MRNLNRALGIVACGLLGASLAAGCGGDDDDSSSGDLTTGIAPSTLLSDVTTEQAAAACERLQQGFQSKLSRDTFIRSLCTLFGAALAETPAECATQRDNCIQQANENTGQGGMIAASADEISSGVGECDGDAELSACTGTVGQYETCLNETLDSVVAVLEGFSCDDAATIDAQTAQEFGNAGFAPAASCDAIMCDGEPLFEE